MGRKAGWIDRDLVDLVDQPCANPSCNEPQYSDKLGPTGLCRVHFKISHRAICLPVRTAEPEYHMTLPGYA